MWKKFTEILCHKDSENESETRNGKEISASGPLIIQEQPRLSFAKWLCTNPSAILPSKSTKVRRSHSWRSLKERGSTYLGHFSSRTLSVDELHQNAQTSSTRPQPHDDQLGHPPLLHSNSSPPRASGLHSTRLANGDASSKRFPRLSSKQSETDSSFRKASHSGGGDSGYSEESFAATSFQRPLHTSCPHCHCEQRSSFKRYPTATKNFSSSSCSSASDSSTSDTTISKERKPSEASYHLFRHKQALSASRSYPHIKPLPKATNNLPNQPPQPRRRTRSVAARRRRHFSCDSSLWPRAPRQAASTLARQADPLSPPVPVPRHFTTIGMLHSDPSKSSSKPYSTLPKNSHVFGELNLAAIELDSYRSSLSSSSSSSSIHREEKRRTGSYLVWHEYRNTSLLSATNGSRVFSVIRGDQVRLLKRMGKSTFLVQKEEDGAIGFLPQSCLAHDQIHSFLSVKGLRETVL